MVTQAGSTDKPFYTLLHFSGTCGKILDKRLGKLRSEYVENTHMRAAFGHLNRYSAVYYTYMWSLVIAKDS